MPSARASACPELDCIRTLLPRHIIAAAEGRARAIGLGADRVLICADAITEEAYLTALAASLGTPYDTLGRLARADCPLDDDQLIQAAATGLLPVRDLHPQSDGAPACRGCAIQSRAAAIHSPDLVRLSRGSSSLAMANARSEGARLMGCGSRGRFSPMRRARIVSRASSLSR